MGTSVTVAVAFASAVDVAFAFVAAAFVAVASSCYLPRESCLR